MRRRDGAQKSLVTDAFDIGVVLKGLDGALEILGGLFLLLVPLKDLRAFLIVIMLLRRRLWAYPTAIVVFTAFGVYQIYQYTYSHSLLLLALTVLDVVVIALTAWEYRVLTARARSTKREAA